MDSKLLRNVRATVAFLHQMVAVLALAVLACVVLAASGMPRWLVLAPGIITAGAAVYAIREHRRFWKQAKKIGLDPWSFYRELPSRRQLLSGGFASIFSGRPVSEDRPAPMPRK